MHCQFVWFFYFIFDIVCTYRGAAFKLGTHFLASCKTLFLRMTYIQRSVLA